MHPSRAFRRAGVLAAASALVIGTSLTITASAAPHGGGTRQPNADTKITTGADSTSAIVRLSLDPLAIASQTAKNGKSIDFDASATKNVRAKLSAQRNTFKQWLKTAAPKAKVTGDYDVAVNAVAVRLNGTTLATLRGGPNVVSASYQADYAPTGADPDLGTIDAEGAWAAANPSGGVANAGTGVKVGVVDTGIDVTHPCFSDAGFPRTKQLGDTRFTNNKVIVAKVFANKAANLGYTAEAIQEHGTHVAGTIACDYRTPASVDGAAIPYAPSGVAPGAQLGSYNVFPGDITNARSEDILNALQAAAEDGMNVINMSLGGGTSGVQDLLTMAVNNLDRANIVVAVSAGNDGPGHYTVGSPGSAERALTAGASSIGHFMGVAVSSGGQQVAGAATGDFPVTQDYSGNLAAAAGDPLGVGCADGSYGDISGDIALVLRGSCDFSTKVANAEKAGAVGVIVVNNVPGDPIAMAQNGTTATTIPAVMISKADLGALTALIGHPVTVGSQPTYIRTGNDDIMADFSSQGPTDVDYRIKPDVVAPGVNILSSVPHTFCSDPGTTGCWAFMQGTSMASPHLAGTAAVVRQAHPSWDASQVRSAIVNTAERGVLSKSTAPGTAETDPEIIGAGRENVLAAVNAKLGLSSVSTTFGAVPLRNGSPQTRTVTVSNLSGASVTVPVSVAGSSAFTVSKSSLSIPAGGTADVTLSFTPSAAAAGDNSATLDLGDLAHAVVYAFGK